MSKLPSSYLPSSDMIPVETVRASPKEKEAFNISELRTLVLCYKRDGDAAIPNKLQELLER